MTNVCHFLASGRSVVRIRHFPMRDVKRRTVARFIVGNGSDRQFDEEGRAFARAFGFCPNFPVVHLDKLLRDVKPKPC